MKQFTCPECGSHYFGTSNCTGPQDTWIRHCHGYYDDARRCDFSFVIADDDKYFADEQNGSKEIDMELRKEYEAIRSRATQGLCVPANQVTAGTVIDAVREAVTACQELADRPPRELTDAEIRGWMPKSWFPQTQGEERCVQNFARAIIAAFLEKQREPATVTVEVRLYRTNSGQTNCVSQVDASLDANFPFGNPTYKWIGDAFEITREIEKGPK